MRLKLCTFLMRLTLHSRLNLVQTSLMRFNSGADASYVQNCTWEGDNNVLLLQTARYVVKAAQGMARGTAPPAACAYLELVRGMTGKSGSAVVSKAASARDWRIGGPHVRAAFEARAARLAKRALEQLSEGDVPTEESVSVNGSGPMLPQVGGTHLHWTAGTVHFVLCDCYCTQDE